MIFSLLGLFGVLKRLHWRLSYSVSGTINVFVLALLSGVTDIVGAFQLAGTQLLLLVRKGKATENDSDWLQRFVFVVFPLSIGLATTWSESYDDAEGHAFSRLVCVVSAVTAGTLMHILVPYRWEFLTTNYLAWVMYGICNAVDPSPVFYASVSITGLSLLYALAMALIQKQ